MTGKKVDHVPLHYDLRLKTVFTCLWSGLSKSGWLKLPPRNAVYFYYLPYCVYSQQEISGTVILTLLIFSISSPQFWHCSKIEPNSLFIKHRRSVLQLSGRGCACEGQHLLHSPCIERLQCTHQCTR